MLCVRATKNQKAIADIIRGWVDASKYDEMLIAEKVNRDPIWFFTALLGYNPFRKDTIYRLVEILKPKKEELHELYLNMFFDETDSERFEPISVWSELDMGGKIKALESLDRLARGEKL